MHRSTVFKQIPVSENGGEGRKKKGRIPDEESECKVPVDKIYYREKKEEVIGHFLHFITVPVHSSSR